MKLWEHTSKSEQTSTKARNEVAIIAKLSQASNEGAPNSNGNAYPATEERYNPWAMNKNAIPSHNYIIVLAFCVNQQAFPSIIGQGKKKLSMPSLMFTLMVSTAFIH